MTRLRLDWTSTPNATGYRVYRGTTNSPGRERALERQVQEGHHLLGRPAIDQVTQAEVLGAVDACRRRRPPAAARIGHPRPCGGDRQRRRSPHREPRRRTGGLHQQVDLETGEALEVVHEGRIDREPDHHPGHRHRRQHRYRDALVEHTIDRLEGGRRALCARAVEQALQAGVGALAALRVGGDEAAVEAHQHHQTGADPWRGNARELKNVVERAVYQASGDVIERVVFDPFDSPFAPIAGARTAGEICAETPAGVKTSSADSDAIRLDKPFGEMVEAYERQLLCAALEQARFNQRKATTLLGLNYHQFRGLYRKYGIVES